MQTILKVLLESFQLDCVLAALGAGFILNAARLLNSLDNRVPGLFKRLHLDGA